MYILNKLTAVRRQRKTLILVGLILLTTILPIKYSTLEIQKVSGEDDVGDGSCALVYYCDEGDVWEANTCVEPTHRRLSDPCDCGCEKTSSFKAQCKSCSGSQCSTSDACGPGSGNTCANSSADCVNCSCVLDPSPSCGYERNTCTDSFVESTPAPGENSTEYYWYCDNDNMSPSYFRCDIKKDVYLRSFVRHTDGSLEEFSGSGHVGIERWGAVSGYGKVDYAGRNGNGVKDVFTTPIKVTSFSYTGGAISHFIPDGVRNARIQKSLETNHPSFLSNL